MSNPDPPTFEPEALYAGETWNWTKSLADYPATTWTLKYYLAKRTGGSAGKISITATASGSDFEVLVTATTTSAYVTGEYAWQAEVSSGTEKYIVGSGTLEIKELLTATTPADSRSHARIVYDALAATVEGRADSTILRTSINGKSIERMSWSELLKAYNHFKALVQAEEDAEDLAKGLSHPRLIKHSFKETSA
jgi:hypothetical protein